ncbi:hypothetical protein F5Y15DRAFT_232106 [Xylariaceae sp. FL0016]|nr:hypothetical protein F5Y15DRAFT_232106 [Xylariaceae sp. FL0016]
MHIVCVYTQTLIKQKVLIRPASCCVRFLAPEHLSQYDSPAVPWAANTVVFFYRLRRCCASLFPTAWFAFCTMLAHHIITVISGGGHLSQSAPRVETAYAISATVWPAARGSKPVWSLVLRFAHDRIWWRRGWGAPANGISLLRAHHRYQEVFASRFPFDSPAHPKLN